MLRTLIIYGTSYGQTAKIAARIQNALVQRGHQLTVVNAADVPNLRLDCFDGIVVGASIIARGHQKVVERFVRANVGLLNATPSAFYSVSASAGSKDTAGREAAERVRDEFLKKLGWQPRLRASIAGAINYTRYNPLLRWYMKRASAKGGGSINTSRDHEYTDWNQVRGFANDFAQLMERSSAGIGEWEPLERAVDDSVSMTR